MMKYSLQVVYGFASFMEIIANDLLGDLTKMVFLNLVLVFFLFSGFLRYLVIQASEL